MKGKIEVSVPTGLPKPSSISRFDIYPNPANETIFINNPGNSGPLKVLIYDISGKIVLKSDNQNIAGDKNSVNVNDLRKGLYFISVSYPDITYTKKFIKL